MRRAYETNNIYIVVKQEMINDLEVVPLTLSKSNLGFSSFKFMKWRMCACVVIPETYEEPTQYKNIKEKLGQLISKRYVLLVNTPWPRFAKQEHVSTTLNSRQPKTLPLLK